MIQLVLPCITCELLQHHQISVTGEVQKLFPFSLHWSPCWRSSLGEAGRQCSLEVHSLRMEGDSTVDGIHTSGKTNLELLYMGKRKHISEAESWVCKMQSKLSKKVFQRKCNSINLDHKDSTSIFIECKVANATRTCCCNECIMK